MQYGCQAKKCTIFKDYTRDYGMSESARLDKIRLRCRLHYMPNGSRPVNFYICVVHYGNYAVRVYLRVDHLRNVTFGTAASRSVWLDCG